MLNDVKLIGHLGADPEARTTASGNPVTNLRLATTERWTDKQGVKQEETEWHSIVTWSAQAENCANYLSKGSKVYVEGKLKTRKWEDKDGVERYTTNIVARRVIFLDSKSEGGGGGGQKRQATPPDDDDVPF